MHPAQQRTSGRPARRTRLAGRGFTLVELLVVITIIAILATLTIRVVGGMVSTARARATQATIAKISAMIDERVQAFNRLDLVHKEASYLSYAGNNAALAKIVCRKDLFRQVFPQSLAEAGLSGETSSNGTGSSEALYHALTTGSVFGGTPVPPDQFRTSEVADTDGDGNLEFVDGWGRPLRFYRWPTRLIRPGGFGTATNRSLASLLINSLPADADLNRDPDDPIGLTAAFTASTFETDYHTLGTYHTPLIVSAGEDGVLGLYEPDSTAGRVAAPINANAADATNALNDSISNLNIRAGGK